MEKRFNLLYVDDERQNLVSFKAAFRRNYHIQVAQSGQEALEILRSTPIDLIISDQRMPAMTGVEFFELVQEEFPYPIRMVLTGYSDMEAIIDAINKGKVYHYVSKPWNEAELKLIIDNALEAYNLKRRNRNLEEERNALRYKSEQLQKENILSRYETLKNQLNPHFLFNCLNALASLVYDDPELAEDFIAKMTKVYRYLLDHREEVLVELSQELAFMRDYFFLQKTRFGDNLQLTVNLAPEVHHKMVPPLTLQLLLENAIKHNIISQEQPLLIEVYTEGEFLILRNNMQQRIKEVASTGIGLQNLEKRYGYLAEVQPTFGQQEGSYVAKVPLLDREDAKG